MVKKIWDFLVVHATVIKMIGFGLLLVAVILMVVIYNRFYPSYLIKLLSIYCTAIGGAIYLVARILEIVKQKREKNTNYFQLSEDKNKT